MVEGEHSNKLQPGCLLGWLRGFFRGHFFGTPRHRSQELPRCRRVWPRLPRVRPQLRRDACLRHTCPRDAHAYATPACAMMCGPVSATLSPARQPACLRDVLRLRDARLLEPATLCRPATLCACAYARNCGPPAVEDRWQVCHAVSAGERVEGRPGRSLLQV